jgi:glucose/arabinose dehydrogenase
MARAQEFTSESGPIRVVTVARGLEHPWGLAFLPDGRMLVTERPGRLRIVARDGTLSAPLAGVPRVEAGGQGGLLDVALAPDFATSRIIYLSYSEPGHLGAVGTSVARGRLGEVGLEGGDPDLPAEPQGAVGGPLRLAAGVRPGRQPVHHDRGAGPAG